MSVPDELKKIADLCQKLQALEKSNAVQAAKLAAEMKDRKPIDLFGEACLKDYADAVKDSRGLTSLRPSVVKELEAVANEPTAAAVKAAQAGIKKHAADVEKETAQAIKADKAKAKQVNTFLGALEAVSTRLGRQATVG